ncbi:transcription initiation factor TFIID subunit D6 [Babesia microti strain RI]|uniref:Transcription initiation factor TFIID subunit D6 n=1 Tax=Babesia microti (strain RI) TaxID=1133968 RepID=A0A1R4AAK5_BABMR|nr:transcription initiation factor TFIID subunit D6 [Babesia microti strain RI]SJK86032.1 transcription initiation factor TFIID subunit D6 [Babesia microti strain RI]|eukprot:XP_012648305.2 transcription initiation factor TFIID subunit D6 [Babesia microti strain RI]
MEHDLNKNNNMNIQDKLNTLDNKEKGRLLAQRGLFSAAEIRNEDLFGKGRSGRRPTLTDKHCILRLPQDVAKLISDRLSRKENPGVTITPVSKNDYRQYDISIDGYHIPLTGVLGELPCLIEAHKTLDGDLLFKSADISQLMIALPHDIAQETLKDMRENKFWEWPDGLTPGTKDIRTRKFKNFEMYRKEDIKEAEQHVTKLLNSNIRDTYHYEVKSNQQVSSLVKAWKEGQINERVVGPDENIGNFLKELEERAENDGYLSDVSEIILSGLDAGQLKQRRQEWQRRVQIERGMGEAAKL